MILSAIGFVISNEIPKIINAKSIFAKGPAANIASCFLLDFFINVFSSGSTNARGIIGTIIDKNPIPLDFTFTLCNF